jgi:hypothetical protein
MNFSKLTATTAAVILLSTSTFSYAVENQANGFKLFSSSLLYFQFRPRYEYADTENQTKRHAEALTSRTLLGGKFGGVVGVTGLKANIEAINVSHFGFVDDYAPEDKDFQVIADPSQTRITQANLEYTIANTTIIAGRKMFTLDNHRYIGHVGWRQMPQTFDMIGVINKSIPKLTVTAGYISRVNRIFADKSLPYGKTSSVWDTNSALLHVNYAFAPVFSLTGYGYMIANVHDTFGLRATGGIKFPWGKVSYEAEYADQGKASLEEDSIDATPNVDAKYNKLGVKVNASGLVAGVAYEVLGKKEGKEGGAFSTPLATLHGMNGWADKFLGTPVDGLVDTSITLGYVDKSIGRLVAIYHIFESDKDSKDYGDELDLIYAKKISKSLSLIAKAALYNQGEDLKNNDTTKYWLSLDYKFSQ